MYHLSFSMFISVEICSPLRSTSVDISCSYQDETVSCTKNVLPGTKATLACKPFYTLSLTGDSAYRELICLDDGLWDNDIIPCIAGIYHLLHMLRYAKTKTRRIKHSL